MDSTEVLYGTMADGLKHFSAKHRLGNGQPGSGARLSVLYSILEVPRTTAENWFKKGILPTAEKARKLQLLLSLCGYESHERQKLSLVLRTFLDTVATVVSIESAASELSVGAENLRSWIRATAQPKRIQQVVDFNESYADRRQAKILEWKKKLEKNGFISSVATPPPVSTVTAPIGVVHYKAVEAAARMVLTMKPLVELLLSELSTVEVRDRFRQLAGQKNVFELKNDLTRLCGETAYKKA